VRPPRGTLLLVALLLLGLIVAYGREFFLDREEPPAFSVEKRQGIAVLLGEGFHVPGVHQFSDDVTVQGVIKMTGLAVRSELPGNPRLTRSLTDGEALNIVVIDGEVTEITRFWMPAAQRMALGIPLHPDRMSIEDWEALAGIGPRLAQAIEVERQQNGDFGSLTGLQRVKGIGSKRLTAWEKYFQAADRIFK
jgi:competence protein ComEA